MPQDISGFGLQLRVIASKTFPAGFSVTQFADDADPLDLPELTIGETAMGLNGDLINWGKANPISVSVSVIPGQDDDLNLAILHEANRIGRGKKGARDIITLVGVYPDGKVITLSGGKLISGPPASSVASAGRMKSKTYNFQFEKKVGI